jgi:O-antigen ligase
MLTLARRRWQQGVIILTALGISYGQALTGGRAGYATWGIVGLLMCMLRWRKYLLLAPVIPFVLAVAVPGAAGRMLQGFNEVEDGGEVAHNQYEITSGRNLIWPYVIDKIGDSPFVGHGRQAMHRTGLRDRLQAELEESFGHPHNAYLQMLLDNGVIGFALVMPFYVIVMWQATSLFREKRDPWCAAVGGMSFALVGGLLVAGMGSESFYPREDALTMWAAIGLMFRVHLQRERALALERSTEDGIRIRQDMRDGMPVLCRP